MSFGRKVISLFTLVFAVAAFTTFVAAQDSSETKTDSADKPKTERKMGRMGREGARGKSGKTGFGRGMGNRGGVVRGLSKLELTEMQRSQIKTIQETHKNGQEPFRMEMKSLMSKMRDGSASEGDKTRMKELRSEMRSSSDQLRTSIVSILTPDQVQKLETMKAEREQKMVERRQRWEQRKQQKTDSTETKNN